MQLHRRHFLAGVSASALAAISSPTKAARFPRGAVPSANPNPLASSRSIINMNTADCLDYAFINTVVIADSAMSYNPADTLWKTNDWSQFIDAEGYPNPGATVAVRAGRYGGGLRVAKSADYSGTYTLTWTGDGTFAFRNEVGADVWTVNAGLSSNYIENSNGNYSNVTGLVPKIVVSLAGTLAGHQLKGFDIGASDPTGSGAYMRRIKFYRTGDESRLLSGKYFRAAWLQQYINLNPGAIRFMNWLGGNGSQNGRWENRSSPNLGGFSGPVNWIASPAYPLGTTGSATYTNANQYVLGTANPTATNPKTTPASMVHQEIVTCSLAIDAVRCGTFTGGGVFRDVASITNGANGRVVSTAHGFATGDTIIHTPISFGMTQLDKVPCVITVIDANTYDTNVNTSTFSAYGLAVTGAANNGLGGIRITISGSTAVLPSTVFIAGVTGTTEANGRWIADIINGTQFDLRSSSFANTYVSGGIVSPPGIGGQFITLKVGSGSDRTAYPIMFPTASAYASTFGDGYIAGNNQPYTFYFDKTLTAFNNVAGVPQFGVWLSRLGGGNTGTFGHNGDIPVEMIASVLVEINQLSQSQGITNPIHGYVNVPHMSLMSMDPDYSSGSNFATNMIGVLLNGSTVGSITYPGIKSINGPSLIVEYSNETWNPTAQDFYCQARGTARWVGSVGETSSMSALRSVCMARDIKAAFPGEARVKFTLAGQGGLGGYLGANQLRAEGTTLYLNDVLVTGGSWGIPISNHDAFAHASYFDPPDQYLGQLTTGGFWDDRAMYFGADNSGALAITATTQSITCNASSTNVIVTTAVSGGSVVVGQTVTGSGTFGDRLVTAVLGSSPNYTITLDSSVSIAGGSILSTSNIVTSSVTNGPPVVGQILVGSGVSTNNNGTFITKVTGAGPFTLTLNQNATLSATVIHSPSNGGVNYIGAANQATALANFAAQLVTGLGGPRNVFSANGYCNPAAPTVGIDATFATAMAGFGKVSIEYEGGNETASGGGSDSRLVFVTALYGSTQWRDGQLAYFNARAGLTATALPAVYLAINGNNNGVPDTRWAYSTPDSYADTTTEGQGLLNSATFVGMSARNLALSP